jgi:hypothetical protein
MARAAASIAAGHGSVGPALGGSSSGGGTVTEAMAEVYLKQGLREKAIEVYDKLSLQNPLNSHIFADKISQIKENKI